MEVERTESFKIGAAASVNRTTLESVLSPDLMVSTATMKKRSHIGALSVEVLREAEKRHIPENWEPIRKSMARFIDSDTFQCCNILLIGATFFLVVLDTDARASGEEPSLVSMAGNYVIIGTYSLEIFFRMYVDRHLFFTDRRSLFDLCVVSADLLGIAIKFAFGQKAASLAFLRIFRILRVLRLFRLLVKFPELNMLLHGLAGAMRAIFWATIMIVLCLVVWSIVSVELVNPIVRDVDAAGGFSGCTRCGKAFDSVLNSTLTFFQTVVLGDSWGSYLVPVIERAPWTAVIFISVVASVHMGLMNLILAVIVDRAQQARHDDTELQLDELSHKYECQNYKMLEWCRKMDRDNKKYLTVEDLMYGWTDLIEFRHFLMLMRLTKNDVGALFHILDSEELNRVSFTAFTEQIFMMRNAGSNSFFLFTLQYVRRLVNSQTDVITEKVCDEMRNFKWPTSMQHLRSDQASARAGSHCMWNEKSSISSNFSFLESTGKEVHRDLPCVTEKIEQDLKHLCALFITEEVALVQSCTDLLVNTLHNTDVAPPQRAESVQESKELLQHLHEKRSSVHELLGQMLDRSVWQPDSAARLQGHKNHGCIQPGSQHAKDRSSNHILIL